MAEYEAGTGYLQILPTTRGFVPRLKREMAGIREEFTVPVRPELDRRSLGSLQAALRSLPAVVLDADASPADREIAALRDRIERLSGTTVGVDLSSADFHREVDQIRGELDRLGRESPEIGVRVDAGAASAALAGVDREVSRVDGRRARVVLSVDAQRALTTLATTAIAINQFANKKYTFHVDADTTAAIANVTRLVTLVTSLSGAAGVIGGFGGALGGLGAAGTVAAGGLGAAVVASLGVGKALSAMSAQEEAAGTEAVASAKKRVAAANQVQSATERLRQAEGNAAQARKDAARSVADAEKRASAAQRTLRQDTAALRREQESLNDAWEAGKRSLEDLQSQVRGNTIDQRQAALDLKDAREELARAQENGDPETIERARIAYDRQLATVDDLARQGKRLAADNAKAQAKGISGSDQVVAANERIAAAQQRVQDSTEAAGDAADAVVRAREQGDRQIAAADQQVVEANRALQQALAATADDTSSTAQKAEQALAQLSPAARAFALYLFSLKPLLEGLSATAATEFFPPLMMGMNTLLTQAPLINTVVGQLAAGMGAGLQLVLTQLASPLWTQFFTLLGNSAGTVIPGLFGSLMNVAGALAVLITHLLPLAPAAFDLVDGLADLLVYLSPFLAVLLGGLIPAAAQFLQALRPLGPVLAALTPILGVLAGALSQVLAAVLTALAPILVALTPLIEAFAVQLATGLVGSIQTLTPFLVAVATWLSENPALVLGVIGVIGTLMGFLKPLAFLLGIVVSWFHGFLVIKVAQAALAAFGLEGSLFGRMLVRLLSPVNLLKMALPYLGRAVMMLGRSVLAAMGPLGWILTIFGLLYSSNEQFRTAINGLLTTILGLAGQLVSALMPAVNMLLGALIPVVNLLFSALMPVFNALVGVIIQIVMAVLPPFIGILQTAVIPIIVALAGILVSVLVWVLENIVVPVLKLLVWVLTNIVIPVILWLANNIIVPAFQLIGTIISWVVNNIVMPVFDVIVWFIKDVMGPAFTAFWRDFVKPAWDGLGKAIEWVWLNVIKPAWDAVVSGLGWLKDGFNDAVDWIGRKWNELRGFLARPINFLIGTVWNQGILVAWNKVAEFLPGIDPVDPLPLIPEFASGGLLRGPGTGTSDDILAINDRGAPAARVSNGEFIVREAVTRRTLPFLEALNSGDGEALQAAGGLARVTRTYRGKSGIRNYAAGGLFQERVDAARDWLEDARGIPYVWGGTVTPAMTGTDCSGMQAAVTHILSGRSPYSGRIGTTASMPWGGFVTGLNSAYAIGNKPSDHMAATLDGQNVEQHGPNGTPFAFPSRWGADASYFTQAFSLPIVGGQFASGGQGSDSGWFMQQVRDIFDDLTQWPIDGIKALVGDPPPMWAKVPPGMATNIRDKVRDFLLGEAQEQGGANGPMDVSNISGPVVDQVRQVAAMYGWDSGPEWTAISQLVNKESSWNPNAANPSSSARGLFQKMTSLHGAVEPTAAGQAAWGLNYIRGRYGSPSKAWAYHQQHNSYDAGGLAVGKGIMFKDVIAPERVLPPQETNAYPTLTTLTRQIEDGRLVPAAGMSSRQLAAAMGDDGAQQPRGDMHAHFYGDIHDPVDVDVIAQRLEFAARGEGF